MTRCITRSTTCRSTAAYRTNITYAEFDAGHMMYINLPDLEKMHQTVEDFLKPVTGNDERESQSEMSRRLLHFVMRRAVDCLALPMRHSWTLISVLMA